MFSIHIALITPSSSFSKIMVSSCHPCHCYPALLSSHHLLYLINIIVVKLQAYHCMEAVSSVIAKATIVLSDLAPMFLTCLQYHQSSTPSCVVTINATYLFSSKHSQSRPVQIAALNKIHLHDSTIDQQPGSLTRHNFASSIKKNTFANVKLPCVTTQQGRKIGT